METIFIHENSICETSSIGRGSRIWAFTHLMAGARLGEECNVCEHVFIENDVVLGNRVTVKSGVYLWDGIRVEDDVFIGPNATFANDKFPRSKQHRKILPPTVLEKGASIGANATILPGITVGRCAMVGAGSVVTNNVPPYAIVRGNPARIGGYDYPEEVEKNEGLRKEKRDENVYDSSVPGVRLFEFPVHTDMRGSLSVGNFSSEVPFSPARYFLVFDVMSRLVRGKHAHIVCKQFLICVKGSINVKVDDGQVKENFLLNAGHKGLFVPQGIWTELDKFTPDSVLLVFASHPYEEKDYIRDYQSYLEYRRKQ